MAGTDVDAIDRNFQVNLVRCRNLLVVYDKLAPGGPGSPSIVRVDVLRSAIVLLHASLEDIVRSASERLLPFRGPDVLSELAFPDSAERGKTKFSLGDLHPYRGQSVDEVIRAAVVSSLQRSNYNSVAEIAAALRRIGLDAGLLDPDQASLEAFLRRRHLIVHRADVNPFRARKRGVRFTQHLSKATAEQWLTIVSNIGSRIIAAVRTATQEGHQ